MIILGAPTSIAQRQGEDTLTYLNKGTEDVAFVLFKCCIKCLTIPLNIQVHLYNCFDSVIMKNIRYYK